MSRLSFQLEATASRTQARAGRFRTLHNEVRTPVFMPVGTQATVKGLSVDELSALGSQVLLANTYHLLLRPGPEVLRQAGGIHPFMCWDRSVLTDSGGFQIFSLPGERRISEAGATFRSYVDGEQILLSPERCIDMQKAIGSDIMMVLDQCVPSTSARDVAAEAMALTHRWARRSLAARGESPQALFGIVQGACFEDLRRESAETLRELPLDGFAIGGLAVGETKAEREHFTELTAACLPATLPRYLMGVGTPLDLVEAVHRGVDLFDCILPSSHAAQGTAFTRHGIFRLKRSVYKLDQGPVDETCACPTCARYSRSYLHHLARTGEWLGWRLLAIHNIHFYHQLMREMREAIFADRFVEYRAACQGVLAQLDPGKPVERQAAKPRGAPLPVSLGAYELREGKVVHAASGQDMHVADLDLDLDRLVAAAAEETEELLVEEGTPGLGERVMAMIRALEAGGARRPVRIVTRIAADQDLDPLRLAVRHVARFPHLQHGAAHVLLRDGVWTSKRAPLRWELDRSEDETGLCRNDADPLMNSAGIL